jgi:hypothetical protein
LGAISRFRSGRVPFRDPIFVERQRHSFPY